MKDNVFQRHGENVDKQQFMKTVGILEEHINKTFSYLPSGRCISVQIIQDHCTFAASKLHERGIRTGHGKENVLGNTHEELHEAKVDLPESNTRAIYAIVWASVAL
jgi:hypothetical protein